MTHFTPGELTTSQARELNEKLRMLEQFARLTVAPPLNLTRAAGIPAIRLDTVAAVGDLVLVEITGHSGTPPVHTAKGQTRDTSNNRVDITPLVSYTQILNPLETAIADGTPCAIFPIPEFPGWWWAIPIDTGSTPDTARCVTHGWLKDREALKKKWFTVGIRGGEVGTRCACVPDQFTDDAVAPYDGIAQAVWDSSTDKWELLRTIETCCGCAKLSLDVTTDGQLEATITMTTTCDSSTPKTIIQKADCYMVGNKALFTFGGLKLCNDEIPTDCESLDCDQSFSMEVECACCELETFDCVNCLESFGPALWRVIGTGFTGSETDYNDVWYLPPSDVCTWSITCGTITVTLVVAADGITVTFQGAGATIIYKFDAATGGVACIGDYTLDWDSGDDANSPATIDIEQVSCLVPCDLGAMRVSSSATICGTLWTDQMMFGTAYEVSTSSGGGSNDPLCEPDPAKDNCKGYGVIISCNPDGTFNVFPYCSPSPGPCYSGPPVILNIPNEATYPDVLFSITYTCDDPDCAECPVSQTLTFTNM